MVETYEGSIKGKDYEIQWYNKNGDYDFVCHCTTLEEFAITVCDYFWGRPKAVENNPTVYYNATRFDSENILNGYCVNERVRKVLMNESNL